MYGKDHIVKGVSVHIGSAQPRTKGGHDHGGAHSELKFQKSPFLKV